MGILVGVTVVSFYLGYVARAESAQASPVVINCPANAYMDAEALSEGMPKTASSLAPASMSADKGAFVASKNGKKYYPTGCSGANRIKEDNKIFFGTRAEAEQAGYGLGAGCK